MDAFFSHSYHTDLDLRGMMMIILVIVAAPYWLGPVLIRFKQTRPARPEPMQLLGYDVGVPPLLLPFVTNARRALGALGFSNFALLRQKSGVVLLAESDSGTVATALALPRKDGQLHSLIGFTTQLEGGGKLRTSNAPLPAILPPPAGESRIRLPRERDTARLHAIHERRVAAAIASGSRVARLTVADPVAYQQREEMLSLSNAVASRYWRPRGDRLGLTWRGAFLSAWRLLPPWRELSVRRDEREARSFSAA